jgi:hypothetical protein
MPTPRISVQFLENAPIQATPQTVRARLRQACNILPIESILLGWNLPPALEEAVAAEASQQGVALYRWHPLLASDSRIALPAAWQTIGSQNQAIPGFRGLPEFTFFCPNHPAASEWRTERIDQALQRGIYQGIFFDRMRWPSPAENLGNYFGCFCPHCQRRAAQYNLDLEPVRHFVNKLLANENGAQQLIQALFQPENEENPLEQFIQFRSACISQTVATCAQQAKTGNLAVGLDCFSPSLMRMVGQDLKSLSQVCDWVKLMIYPHTHGPAGLPYELHALANWLATNYGIPKTDGLQFVRQASQIDISAEQDCPAETIQHEIDLAKTTSKAPLFAGLALVQMETVHGATDVQIQEDLFSCQASQPAGLTLSWDLWLISPQRLNLIAQTFV